MCTRESGRRNLRDVFISNMSNKEGQTELCRSTKTPDEVYRVALSYKRGDKYSKTYKISGRGLAAAPVGALQIKTEPFNANRGEYRRPFQRSGQGAGRADRKCFNCDQGDFTPEHFAKCPARNATCNCCRKTGNYERTCRGRKAANRGRVGMIHDEGTEGEYIQNDQEGNGSNYRSSVGWVTN